MKAQCLKSPWTVAAAVLCFAISPGWGQNMSLPVYQVLQSGATAVQARELADMLKVPFNELSNSNGQLSYINTSNFMAVPTAPVTDPAVISNLLAASENPFPDIPLRFEQVDFGALGKMTVPSDDLALRMAGDAFGQTGLGPQFGSPIINHTIFQAYYSNDNRVVVSNLQPVDTRVEYKFATPDGSYPMMGPGAQVQLVFGPDGKVTQLHYAARQLEAGPSVPIIPADEAVRRVSRLFPPNAKITPQLVYWCPPFWWHWPWPCPCPPPPWEIKYILPWYQFTATVPIIDPLTGEQTQLQELAQMIPATDDPAFVPAVQLSASTFQSTQVVASVSVTGGMAPYTYEWTGSAPNLATNGGTNVMFVPVVALDPPELSIRRPTADTVEVSWLADPHPSPWFVPESSPSLAPASWGPPAESVVTSNGISSVIINLANPARYFRLRLADPPLMDTETVGVTVTDANGVQGQDTKTVDVQVFPVPKSATSDASGIRPKIVGVVDWGTESPFDPGLGTGDRTSWTTGMILGGAGVQRFLWTDTLAWKKDFIQPPVGIDTYEVDNADMVFYVGHGNPEVFTFTGGPGPSPTTLRYYDAPHAWGNHDTEWICLLSCDVLEFNDAAGNVWQRWGPNFDGLHILTGFHSLAYAGTGFPFTYSQNMLGGFFGFFPPPMRIVSAWFAAAHSRGTGSPAAMGPIGPGGVCDFNDYYWGKGSVGPTIRASQIHGWWYYSQ